MLLPPKISVVMPVYNREQYLKESIESILNQTFTDFEFIIVDDQSKDSSWQIIQDYATKDSRITAVKNNGIKGCWAARNLGWDLTKGKYMAIMDSDDIALPERLQKEFDFMEQNPDIDICGAWMKNFGKSSKIISFPTSHQDIRDQLFFINSMSQPTVIMRLSSVSNIRYKNTVTEDYELWCRIIDNLKFANIPEALIFYRIHANQIGVTNKTEQNNNADDIRLRNLENIGLNLSDEEKRIYLELLYWSFAPKNKKDLLLATQMLNNISIAGLKHGYKLFFQDRIKNLMKNLPEYGIKNKATSLKLYFTIFRKWKIFETPRANLRYIYHCLRDIFHV